MVAAGGWCSPAGELRCGGVRRLQPRFEEAAAEADTYEGPGGGLSEDETVDLAEQASDALTEALLERFGVFDAEAVAHENSFWHIGAEELGYGMNV
ncbi:hypothetical protein [Streptomyces fagopyri]|uniref:hypothetical protein n=1 Tax=Streptomyces fagopyri TaxID=2662397 RepID=UPI003718788F